MSILRSLWSWRGALTCVGCHRDIDSDTSYYQVHQGLLDDLALAIVLLPHCYHTRCLDPSGLVLGLGPDETLCVTYIQS
jgi:hypothetical protein